MMRVRRELVNPSPFHTHCSVTSLSTSQCADKCALVKPLAALLPSTAARRMLQMGF